MESESGLLQKMKKMFSESEDKEQMAEEIVKTIQEGYDKGVLTKREMKMIFNIFEYMDSDAREIMTHRKNIVAIDGDMTLEKAVEFMVNEKNSRFPVYEEDIDGIIGIIHLRDAMRCYFQKNLRTTKVKDLKEFIHSVKFIPETKSIDKLFQKMQTDKFHMAIVIDEYGQTAGIVTMEDIIEEIVGNIQDEYDNEEELIKVIDENTYLVDGVTHLSLLEDILEISFNVEEFDTLNGFLVDKLERIPSEDEKCAISYEGYDFIIESVDNNMIKKVKIERKHGFSFFLSE